MRKTCLVTELQRLLQKKAAMKTKIWWENYLKRVIPFRGVKMVDIRTALHAWFHGKNISTRLSQDAQKDLVFCLLREKYAEDKLAGILFLQEILLPTNAIQWQVDLPRFACLFQENNIKDWNTCDWLSVKVLGPLAQKQGKPCAQAISAWRDSDSLWQRRAAGVSFVHLAKNGDANFSGFTDMLLRTCAVTVQDSQRFSQTGTGWVLRELSCAEPQKVMDFITKYRRYFSSEGLRYALEKFSPLFNLS